MAAANLSLPFNTQALRRQERRWYSIKSSVALGILLNEGIGDTIRISVNGDPCEEIVIAKQLLKCLHLRKNVR